MDKKFLTAEEAAELYGISVEKIRELAADGHIQALADRGTWRYRKSELDAAIHSLAPSDDAPMDLTVRIEHYDDSPDAHPELVGELPPPASTGRGKLTSDFDRSILDLDPNDDVIDEGSFAELPAVVDPIRSASDSDVALQSGSPVAPGSSSDVVVVKDGSHWSSDVIPAQSKEIDWDRVAAPSEEIAIEIPDDASFDFLDDDTPVAKPDSSSDVVMAGPEIAGPSEDVAAATSESQWSSDVVPALSGEIDWSAFDNASGEVAEFVDDAVEEAAAEEPVEVAQYDDVAEVAASMTDDAPTLDEIPIAPSAWSSDVVPAMDEAVEESGSSDVTPALSGEIDWSAFDNASDAAMEIVDDEPIEVIEEEAVVDADMDASADWAESAEIVDESPAIDETPTHDADVAYEPETAAADDDVISAALSGVTRRPQLPSDLSAEPFETELEAEFVEEAEAVEPVAEEFAEEWAEAELVGDSGIVDDAHWVEDGQAIPVDDELTAEVVDGDPLAYFDEEPIEVVEDATAELVDDGEIVEDGVEILEEAAFEEPSDAAAAPQEEFRQDWLDEDVAAAGAAPESTGDSSVEVGDEFADAFDAVGDSGASFLGSADATGQVISDDFDWGHADEAGSDVSSGVLAGDFSASQMGAGSGPDLGVGGSSVFSDGDEPAVSLTGHDSGILMSAAESGLDLGGHESGIILSAEDSQVRLDFNEAAPEPARSLADDVSSEMSDLELEIVDAGEGKSLDPERSSRSTTQLQILDDDLVGELLEDEIDLTDGPSADSTAETKPPVTTPSAASTTMSALPPRSSVFEGLGAAAAGAGAVAAGAGAVSGLRKLFDPNAADEGDSSRSTSMQRVDDLNLDEADLDIVVPDDMSASLAADSDIGDASLDESSGLVMDGEDSGLVMAPQDSGLNLGVEDSGLLLEPGDSGLLLADEDSGLSLAEDSGISLSADSGIGLLPDDSGISLEAEPEKPKPRAGGKSSKPDVAARSRTESSIPAFASSMDDSADSATTELSAMDEDFDFMADDAEGGSRPNVLMLDDEEEVHDDTATIVRKEKKKKVVVEEEVEELDLDDELDTTDLPEEPEEEIEEEIAEADEEDFEEAPESMEEVAPAPVAAGPAPGQWDMMSILFAMAAGLMVMVSGWTAVEAMSTMWTGAEPSGIYASTLGGVLGK